MKINDKNISFYLIIFVIFSLLAGIYAYFSRYSCFVGDDFWYTRFFEPIGLLHTLSFTQGGHGGGYIGYFLCKLFSFGMPLYLNIHPSDFINTYHSIIRGLFFATTLLLISKFSTFYNRSKLIYTLSFLLLGGICFFNFVYSCNVIYINYSFYRYLFSFIPYSILWYYIYKNLIEGNKKLNKFEFVIAFISAYFVGTSLEIISFGSVFLAIMLIIYNCISKFLLMNKTDNKNFKLNLDFKFYFLICTMFFTTYMFASSLGFKEVATHRGMSNISITFDMLKEYLQLYFNVCFVNEWFYWLLFIIFSTIFFINAKKQNEIKKVILPLFMQISILTVMFSLILCGKTFDYDTTTLPKFWLYHENIIFAYKLLILIPLLISFDYCYNFVKNNPLVNIILCTFILIITCKNFVYFFNNFSIQHMKDARVQAYQIEKIMRYYYLHGEIPIINANYFSEVGQNGEKYDYNSLENNRLHRGLFLKSMDMIYKNNDATTLGVILDDNALEKFYEKGGTFSEKELEELKFERLKDDDFVLNKKAP